jgi:hypothetical protein
MRIDRKNVDIGSNGANEKATRDGVGDDGTPAIPLIVNNPTRNKNTQVAHRPLQSQGIQIPLATFTLLTGRDPLNTVPATPRTGGGF